MFLPYRPLRLDGVEILTCMTEAETVRLRELAVDARVLEIGSAHGWSTCNLAQVAEYVTAVDVHDETAAHAAPKSLETLRKNVMALGLKNVAIRIGRSLTELPDLRRDRATFGGVFIDGDHSYGGCMYDLQMGWLMLDHGGFLAVHDYDEDGHCPDVKLAVDDFAERASAGITIEDPTDTLWVARKR